MIGALWYMSMLRTLPADFVYEPVPLWAQVLYYAVAVVAALAGCLYRSKYES